MLRLLLESGDHGVVFLIGPADVDPREYPAGDDDGDSQDDAEGDVADHLGGKEAAPEGDQEDEAVVDDQGDRGELDGEAVLAGDEVLELGILEELEVAVGGVAHEAGILPQPGKGRQL